MTTQNCRTCMQRETDLDAFITLLGKFPPYHGPGYNYTKDEVEDWLSMTRDALKKRKTSFEPKETGSDKQ